MHIMGKERAVRSETGRFVEEREVNHMSRGVRRTAAQKLQEEIMEVQGAIAQYEASLETMKQREKELSQEIQLEEFKAVSQLLKGQDMSLSDLKELLEARELSVR